MRISNFLSKLAKQGEAFTIEDAHRITHIDRPYLRKLLYRLEKRGAIERIERGRYIIVPLYSEKGKYTLHEFIIGSLLVEPCAISYWSALNHYGLTEQIPTTVFVQTISWKKKQEIEVFGVRYRIVRIKATKLFGIRKEWIEETQINITDKEKTIIDCLDKPHYCGGVIEVAKALRNKNLNRRKLSEYAQQIGNSGVIRRLGYLCDLLGMDIDISPVETKNYLLLDPTMPHRGSKNAKWRLIINLDEKILGKLE